MITTEAETARGVMIETEGPSMAMTEEETETGRMIEMEARSMVTTLEEVVNNTHPTRHPLETLSRRGEGVQMDTQRVIHQP